VEASKFRRATRSDTDRIAEIMIGDPQQVTTQVGMKVFGVEKIDQLKMIAHAMAVSTKSWRFTTVAEAESNLSGFLQTSEPSLKMTPRLIFTAIRIYGPFFVRELMPRIKLLNRVQTVAPSGAFRISEIHVAPEYRGQGIGSELLRLAEEEARSGEHPVMSLQTWTTNPATRLYERFGFRVVDTSTDPDFERLTGVAGNNLLIKELTQHSSS